MRRLVTIGAALALAITFSACDSGGDNEPAPRPQTPNNVITGYYAVFTIPAGATITYTVLEFGANGAELSETDPVILEAATAGSQVRDLYDGAEPAGVAIKAKMTAGSGTFALELWDDENLVKTAQTTHLNTELYVNGGSAPNR